MYAALERAGSIQYNRGVGGYWIFKNFILPGEPETGSGKPETGIIDSAFFP